ncbi:MAG TPA: pectate lyase [Gemmataceae bacterium]|nr:pectate lyase [Gemmataceae bacterium]
MLRNYVNACWPLAAIGTFLMCLAAASPTVARAEGGMGKGPAQYLKKADAWFAGDEAKRVATNILSHQADAGGWPKNTDTTQLFKGDRKTLQPTFDNDATTDEIRYLAHMYKATKDETYSKAALKGIDYILKAQYPTGGWPQFYPPPKSYHRHITFNDHAMIRVMSFLRESYSQELYGFASPERNKQARLAFDRGVECILKCQIKVKDKLTAWCAQHDEIDYSPRLGRPYELPSLSGAESVKIAELLMSLEKPRPEIVKAVDAAAAWFDSAKLKGIRQITEKDPKAPKGTNRVVVKDPNAPPMWARFYEINTNRPIFVDRDGIAKYELADIGYERRNGYAWLGYWPQKMLEQEYPAWKKKTK